MRVGDIYELKAQAMSDVGAGICVHEDHLVQVPGLFVSEAGRARIEHIGRNGKIVAKLLERTTDHSQRRAPLCEHHSESQNGACTGCPLMELAEPVQCELKQTMLKERYGLEVDRVQGIEQAYGYRYSSKRIAYNERNKLKLGSYIRGSHRVADMHNCHVDHSRIIESAHELVEQANRLNIIGYNEHTKRGDLRYVWFKTNGKEVLTTLITSSSLSRAADELASVLTRSDGVAWSVQASDGNAIRGSQAQMIAGKKWLDFKLAEVPIEIGPLGFFQPNPYVIEMAYRDLLCDGDEQGEIKGKWALDLYSGVGVTFTRLQANFAQVKGCELYVESKREGIEALSAEAFLTAINAERFKNPSDDVPDLVLANPPRSGIGENTCKQLADTRAKRLHIMSCHPAALSRDIQSLSAQGYRLRALRAYDSLPHTVHIELVAKLERIET